MSVRLLNEDDLNQYISSFVFKKERPQWIINTPFQTQQNLQSTSWIENNKKDIVQIILFQYLKKRMLEFLENTETHSSFLTPVQTSEQNLPNGSQKNLTEHKNVFKFDSSKVPSSLNKDISNICDFLYAYANKYVSQKLILAKKINKSPKIRFDYLKTINHFSSLKNVLETIHRRRVKLDKENYFASLNGTEFIKKLPGQLNLYRLLTPEAVDFERATMKHLIGVNTEDLKTSLEIYSVRDEKGNSHATFEIRENELFQCKGKGNKAPIGKYISAIIDFIKSKDYTLKKEPKDSGIIYQNREYYNLYDLPKGFVIKGDLDLSNIGLTKLPNLSDVIIEGTLNCSGNPLSSFKNAPRGLKKLTCCNCGLTSLEDFPNTLEELNCSGNPLSSFKNAPHGLKKLTCCDCGLTTLEDFPNTLEELNCSGNPLSSFKNAPRGLKKLTCYDCGLTTLEDFPNTLEELNCSGNLLSSFKNAPRGLKKLTCCNCGLTSLEDFPNTLEELNCSENIFSSFKNAPQKLKSLNCSYCGLTTLEDLPNTLKELNCSGNLLSSFKNAPHGLKKLKCCNCGLTSLEDLPNALEELNCSGNLLSSLKNAPRGLKKLTCCNCGLTTLEGAPQTLTVLNCSGNNLTSLENAPHGLQELNCSFCKITLLVNIPAKVKNLIYTGNPIKKPKRSSSPGLQYILKYIYENQGRDY